MRRIALVLALLFVCVLTASARPAVKRHIPEFYGGQFQVVGYVSTPLPNFSHMLADYSSQGPFTFDSSSANCTTLPCLRVSIQSGGTGSTAVTGNQANGTTMQNPIGICGLGSGTPGTCNTPRVCDKWAIFSANNTTVGFVDEPSGVALTLTSGLRYYMCSIVLVVNGTTNVTFVQTTGVPTASTCPATTSNLTNAMTFGGVGQGLSAGSNMNFSWFTSQSQAPCITSSAAIAVSGWATYSQAP